MSKAGRRWSRDEQVLAVSLGLLGLERSKIEKLTGRSRHGVRRQFERMKEHGLVPMRKLLGRRSKTVWQQHWSAETEGYLEALLSVSGRRMGSEIHIEISGPGSVDLGRKLLWVLGGELRGDRDREHVFLTLNEPSLLNWVRSRKARIPAAKHRPARILGISPECRRYYVRAFVDIAATIAGTTPERCSLVLDVGSYRWLQDLRQVLKREIGVMGARPSGQSPTVLYLTGEKAFKVLSWIYSGSMCVYNPSKRQLFFRLSNFASEALLASER